MLKTEYLLPKSGRLRIIQSGIPPIIDSLGKLVRLDKKMGNMKDTEMYRFWVSEVNQDSSLSEERLPFSSDASEASSPLDTSKASHISSNLRIMTFNSLAHSLVDFKYEENDKDVMDWDARKIAILNVIKRAKAHIVCLQEIDSNDYSEFFSHKFKDLGYEGIYKQKNDRKDGVAILYDSDIFDILFVDSFDYPSPSRSQVAIILSLVVKRDVDFEQMELSESNDDVSKSNKLPSIGGFNNLTVCNTHLLFNRKRGDIKLFQLINLLTHVIQMEEKCRNYFTSHGQDFTPSTFICGDFNFTPQSLLYKFLDKGYIDLYKARVDHLSGQHLMFEHSYNVNSHGHHHSGATVHTNYRDDILKPSNTIKQMEFNKEEHINKFCTVSDCPRYSTVDDDHNNCDNGSLYNALQYCASIHLFKQVPEYLKLKLMKSFGDLTPDTVSSEGKYTTETSDVKNFGLFESRHPTLLYCPIKLRSAYSSFDPYLRTYQEPAFTAFHGWQRGCVDYIWYTPKFVQVKAIFNMPSYGEVTSHGNMPNKVCNSSISMKLICNCYILYLIKF